MVALLTFVCLYQGEMVDTERVRVLRPVAAYSQPISCTVLGRQSGRQTSVDPCDLISSMARAANDY
jgi:hypothetical protein